MDWGYTNPGVLQVWALDGDGRMYLVHELYRCQRLIGWWVQQARQERERFNPETFVCDPAEPAYLQEFRAAGLPVAPGYNEIAPGIQAVQQRLQVAGDGRPRLYMLRDALCEHDEVLANLKKPVCTEQELDCYMWARGADGRPVKEVPLDVDNHGCDAARYAACYVDGLGRRPVTIGWA